MKSPAHERAGLLSRSPALVPSLGATPDRRPSARPTLEHHYYAPVRRRAPAQQLDPLGLPRLRGFQGGEIPKSLPYLPSNHHHATDYQSKTGNGSLLLHIAPLTGCIYTLELSKGPRFLRVPPCQISPPRADAISRTMPAVVCGLVIQFPMMPGAVSRFRQCPGSARISSRSPFPCRPTSRVDWVERGSCTPERPS